MAFHKRRSFGLGTCPYLALGGRRGYADTGTNLNGSVNGPRNYGADEAGASDGASQLNPVFGVVA